MKGMDTNPPVAPISEQLTYWTAKLAHIAASRARLETEAQAHEADDETVTRPCADFGCDETIYVHVDSDAAASMALYCPEHGGDR